MITIPPFRWRQQLFTGNGTFVVPDGVELIYADMVNGGDGGGGGYIGSTGGGGAGGTAGIAIVQFPLAVTPGETLTVIVGAGGLGGPASSNATPTGQAVCQAGMTSIVGSTGRIGCLNTSAAGLVQAGGSAAGGVTTTGFGTTYVPNYAGLTPVKISLGGAGGAPGANGVATSFGGPCMSSPNHFAAGGSGAGTLGGGGAGGHNQWGKGGDGGNPNTAGAAATGYGAGGGGGGAGLTAGAGGNGAPGFARIYWWGA